MPAPFSSLSGDAKILASSSRTAASGSKHSTTRRKTPTRMPSIFESESSIPRLERFVEAEHLPDELIVHDYGNLTNRRKPLKPTLYRRVWSPNEDDTTGQHRRGVLHLDPSESHTIAVGRRSTVHRATLEATLGPAGAPRQRVSVVAKLPTNSCRSHYLLHEEGKAYSVFPHEFFHASPPVSSDSSSVNRFYQPAMHPHESLPAPDWEESMWDHNSPTRVRESSEDEETEPPIVPMFYGLYLPYDSSGTRCRARCHRDCIRFPNADCEVHWPKSIILMEECGEQVDVERMSAQQRKHCLGLVERMHRQGFSHGNSHPRNMLVQPGPLSVSREARSMDTPSFRLISFGRWRGLHYPIPLETARGARRAFENGKETDLILAMSGLGMIAPFGQSSSETSEVSEEVDCEEIFDFE